MCRVLAYLGRPIPLENLLYKPDSSLLKQSYRPQMLDMLNLAGFGMMAWDPSSHLAEMPYRYATTEMPVFDESEMGLGSGELFDQAVSIVLRHKKASTSYIQRRLQIGYNRAASIMERMEKEGVVGPANHAGKREILIETGGADED